MYGGYIYSGSAVYFSLSRAITRMAADIAREVEVGSEEAARTTKYYFTKGRGYWSSRKYIHLNGQSPRMRTRELASYS